MYSFYERQKRLLVVSPFHWKHRGIWEFAATKFKRNIKAIGMNIVEVLHSTCGQSFIRKDNDIMIVQMEYAQT